MAGSGHSSGELPRAAPQLAASCSSKQHECVHKASTVCAFYACRYLRSYHPLSCCPVHAPFLVAGRFHRRVIRAHCGRHHQPAQLH
jgi:hypothetical protein